MGTGLMDDITFVGLDVHKATVPVAVAEGGRGGEVRRVGVVENRRAVLAQLADRVAKDGRQLSFCYWHPDRAIHRQGRRRRHRGCRVKRGSASVR